MAASAAGQELERSGISFKVSTEAPHSANNISRKLTFRSTILAFLTGVIDTELDPVSEKGEDGSLRLRLITAFGGVLVFGTIAA